jgi:uncharacterized protein (DUF302 family)
MNAIETVVQLSMSEAEAAIREALARQGFGVLTEIDIAATLKAKLGIERTPLKILGACNPHFAHAMLEQDPTMSLLLPCNVVIESIDGGTRVAALDPLELVDDPELGPIADEASARLHAAIDELAASAGG